MSDHIEVQGEVISVDRNGFKVELESDGSDVKPVIIFARLSGKMRQHRIRVLLGDKVTVKVSPFDLSHGILTRRH